MTSKVYGTRLVFSGVESRRLLDSFTSFQIPHIMLSYYYLRKVFAKPEHAEPYLKKFETVILDSGLIFHKYKSDPEKLTFLEDYAEYVCSLHPSVYHGVVTHLDLELDKKLDENKLIYPLEDLEDLMEGDQKAIFSNIEYIGISNKVVSQEDRMNQICSQARKHGTRLHAFGVASKSVLSKWPIYTSNTSSWRTGSRYANTYIYEGIGRGLRLFQPTDKSDLAKTDREKKNFRTRQKNIVETKQPALYNQIDWNAILEDDDAWEVDKANLSQWLLFQRDLELEGRNAYWLTEQDKQELTERKKDSVVSTSSNSRENRDGEDRLPQPRQTDEVITGEIIEPNEDNLPVPYKGRLRELDIRLLQPRQCDSCILANRCPKYEAGASCAFGLTESYDVANLDGHIDEDVADLLSLQKDRILQGYLEEKADGAGLSKDLSREIKTYLEMVGLFKEATSESVSASIKAKGRSSTGLLDMFKGNK